MAQATRSRPQRWDEIASTHLGEPVLASVILMRKGMVRNQMLSGLNPVSGVLGGAVEAVVDGAADVLKEQMRKRRPLNPIDVDSYAFVAVGASRLAIIKPADLSLTTADALRRGKAIVLVPRAEPITLTVGKKGLLYRDVTLDVSGFAPTAFKAQWRHWANLEKVVASLAS
jgi:hypothetical protein